MFRMQRPMILLVGTLTAAAASADEKLAGIACRSVHLGYSAPVGTAFYNEVAVEQSADGTYFMVCGWSKGYFGMQELASGKKLVLFSVWDPAAGNDPATVPAAPPYRAATTTPTTQAPPTVVAIDQEDEQLKIVSHTGEGDPAKRSLAMAIRGGFRFALNGPDQLGAAKFETGGQVTMTNEAGWQHYLRTTKPA